MIHLPVLTELEVRKYGLFPGEPAGNGIAMAVSAGSKLDCWD